MHSVEGMAKSGFSEALYPKMAVAETPLAKADIILVLGNIKKGAARLLAIRAARLYRRGYAPSILVTGGVIDEEGLKESANIKLNLLKLGVPETAILIEDKSTNTKENFINARSIANCIPHSSKRPNIIIVGQKFASRRILMTAAAQWPEAIPMLSSVCMIGKPLHLWHKDPSVARLVQREVEKIRIYLAKGDIAEVNETALREKIARSNPRIQTRKYGQPSTSLSRR